MLLDLKSLFSGDVERIPFSYSLDLSDTEMNGLYPFASPVLVEGAASASFACILLQAEASFDYEAPCDRCAVTTKRQYRFAFSHVLAHEMEEENDDYILVDDSFQLDLDELLRSDILLELPYKYLCREDCKGLCPSCGKNLNDGSCSCNLHQVDPRLEVLKKLID